ncbi:MAG TPA: type II toxin-antitoxin system RelE/ParE family toxin [Thermoanaerobaculia bacterium]
MASFDLLIKPSAVEEIESLPKGDRQRVVTRIAALALEPRPPGCEKLSGQERYRVRQGNYRILYEVRERELIVMVVKVGDRKVVYR